MLQTPLDPGPNGLLETHNGDSWWLGPLSTAIGSLPCLFFSAAKSAQESRVIHWYHNKPRVIADFSHRVLISSKAMFFSKESITNGNGCRSSDDATRALDCKTKHQVIGQAEIESSHWWALVKLVLFHQFVLSAGRSNNGWNIQHPHKQQRKSCTPDPHRELIYANFCIGITPHKLKSIARFNSSDPLLHESTVARPVLHHPPQKDRQKTEIKTKTS